MALPHPETLIEAAQTLLTGYDTALNYQWRIEDRAWRVEDIDFRERERDQMTSQCAMIDKERAWRYEDVEQIVVENARAVWTRYVDKNRRNVEERAEMLRGISDLSVLIALFAVVSFMEFSFTFDGLPYALLLLYAATALATFVLEIVSVVSCLLMQASILKMGATFVSEDVEWDFMLRCREFARNFRVGDVPPAPIRNFEAHWRNRCEDQFVIAFGMFSAGIGMFLVNITASVWIKFYERPWTAVGSTVVLVIAFVALLLIHFSWAPHLVSHQDDALYTAQLKPAGLPFDWHLPPTFGTAAHLHLHNPRT